MVKTVWGGVSIGKMKNWEVGDRVGGVGGEGGVGGIERILVD